MRPMTLIPTLSILQRSQMTLSAGRSLRHLAAARVRYASLGRYRAGVAWCCASMLFIALSLPAGASTPAVDFTLKSNQGDNLRLFDYRGRVVMLSFIKDRCRNCEQQLRALGAKVGGDGEYLQALTAVAFLQVVERAQLLFAIAAAVLDEAQHDHAAAVIEQAHIIALIALQREIHCRGAGAGGQRQSDEQHGGATPRDARPVPAEGRITNARCCQMSETPSCR